MCVFVCRSAGGHVCGLLPARSEASDGMGCSAGSAADAGGQPLLEHTVSVMQLVCV